jgi:hypothetical protein
MESAIVRLARNLVGIGYGPILASELASHIDHFVNERVLEIFGTTPEQKEISTDPELEALKRDCN